MRSSKGRRAITKALYDKIVDAFRAHGRVYTLVAAQAGVTPKTAARAWTKGWPAKGFPPVQDVITEEQAAARARLAEIRTQENTDTSEREAALAIARPAEAIQRERMRSEAIEARAEEAKLVRAARRNAIALQATMRQLLAGGHQLAERVRKELADADLTVLQSAKVFREIANMTRATIDASKTAMEMERKLLGQPESVIGHLVELGDDAAAAAEIALAAKAVARARRAGLLPPLAGGDVIDVDFELPKGISIGDRVRPVSAIEKPGQPKTPADATDGDNGPQGAPSRDDEPTVPTPLPVDPHGDTPPRGRPVIDLDEPEPQLAVGT